jgi:hypothetical protein
MLGNFARNFVFIAIYCQASCLTIRKGAGRATATLPGRRKRLLAVLRHFPCWPSLLAEGKLFNIQTQSWQRAKHLHLHSTPSRGSLLRLFVARCCGLYGAISDDFARNALVLLAVSDCLVSGCGDGHVIALGFALTDYLSSLFSDIQLDFVEEFFVILIKETVGLMEATRLAIRAFVTSRRRWSFCGCDSLERSD